MSYKSLLSSFVILLLFFVFTGNVAAQNFDPAVSVFGEGTISTRDFEFNAAFTPNGKRVYFSKALLPDWRKISIVYSDFDGKAWSKPKLAAFSGRYRDADPVITADGKRLIFISDRPSPLKTKPTDYNLWYVELAENAPNEPKLLEGEFYKTNPSPLYPTVAKSGNLYYSAISDSPRDSEIYVTRLTNNRYGAAEKLDFNSPSEADLDPMVAPDESFIIFTSSTRKGVGGNDLWVSFNEGGKWGEPINLGRKINSTGNEGQSGLSQDGKRLYFSTIRNKQTPDFAPRDRVITQKDFEGEFETIFNGLPNIWEADISDIFQLKNGKP